MQYDYKKLKEQYQEKSAAECVNLAKQWNEEMIERGEQLVGLLWYLEKSKRYQEIKGFKKLSFRVFVWEACHISYNRYRELLYAYNWYPKESRKLGPQTIQTIRNRVGVTKIPKVLKEITATVSKIKNPIKKREAIQDVIEKHAVRPKAVVSGAGDTKSYWKHKYDGLVAQYRALQKENQELRAQIQRQKGPITTFMEIKDKILDTSHVSAAR